MPTETQSMQRTTLIWVASFLVQLAPLQAAETRPNREHSSLVELEARASSENQYPRVNPAFHQEVVLLVESNTLASGDEFLRTATIAASPFPDYRSFRIRYELTLTAAALGKHEAEKLLPSYWDELLQTLGRPMRFDVWDLVKKNPDDDRLTLDPAPKTIQLVMLRTDDARRVANGSDNGEVQAIVDADQAIRKRWNQLSEAEIRAMPGEDRRRNLRVREIVNRGELHTARDFENASLVMQHSSSFAGFELAHELAVCSMLLGDRGMGRWLVAATYDRMLSSIGHLQRFGTQGALTAMGDAKPRLADTDESGICDAERLALGCPALAAKRADFFTPHPKS
jgi:hypothetical protein